MVTATFKNGETTATANGLEKYDYGQILRIKGLDLPQYVAVQFAASGMSEAMPPVIGETVEGVTDALIPNSLLRSNIRPWDYTITAYIYIVSGDSGKTEYTITMPVKWRPRTGDDHLDEDPLGVIGKAVEQVNSAATRAETAASEVETTAAEIAADREQIQTNTTEISGLKQDVEGINTLLGYDDSLFVSGFLNSEGKFANPSNTGLRMVSPYIICGPDMEVQFMGEFGNIYVSTIAFYDTNYTVLLTSNVGEKGKYSVITSPPKTVYCRLSIYSISDAHGLKIKGNAIYASVSERVASVSESVASVSESFSFLSAITDRNGNIQIRNANDWVVTQKIACKPGQIIKIKAEFNNIYVGTLCFYDANDAFLSHYSDTDTPREVQSVTVPEQAASFTACFPANSSKSGYVLLLNGRSIIGSRYNISTLAEKLRSETTELRSETTELRSETTELRSETTELRSETTELRSEKVNRKIGKNLFNKNDIEYDKYINSIGSFNHYENFYLSAPIAVKPNTTYTLKNISSGGGYPWCMYDRNLNKVGVQEKIKTFTTTEDTAYVRVSEMGGDTQAAKQQLEEGNTSTEYEAYTEFYPVEKNTADIEKIKELLGIVEKTNLRTVLPKEMFTVVNKMLPIYFENILFKGLHDCGDVYVSSGTRTSRLQQILFSDASEQSVRFACREGMRKGVENQISIRAVDASNNEGKTINLLFIGDSFTDIGAYCKETKALLEADGAYVNLIGTCGGSTFKAEGLSGGTIGNTLVNASAGVARIVDVVNVTQAPNTGYPGRVYQDDTGKQWTIRGSKINVNGSGKMVVTKYGATEDDFVDFPSSGMLTKVSSGGEGDTVISYTGASKAYFNPFIDPTSGELDILSYLSRWEFEAPDVIVIQFTFNDIPDWAEESSLQAVTDRFVIAVNHFHENLPLCKIVISVEPYGQVDTNKDWVGKKYSVLKWVEMLSNTFETDDYSEFVKIAPSYACVDLVNGYSNAMITPSDRYKITEISHGDGVHPGTGMLEIADCIYPIITYFVG